MIAAMAAAPEIGTGPGEELIEAPGDAFPGLVSTECAPYFFQLGLKGNDNRGGLPFVQKSMPPSSSNGSGVTYRIDNKKYD